MIKKAEKEVKVVMTERLYEVVRQPVVTEKAMKISENGQVVFFVDPSATKPEIKKAVEGLFKVKVKAVNIINTKGKTKMFRGQKGVRSDKKKAIVSLADGQNIDVTTGV